MSHFWSVIIHLALKMYQKRPLNPTQYFQGQHPHILQCKESGWWEGSLFDFFSSLTWLEFG